MTAATFRHGIELIQSDAGPRPITTVSSAIIGIVGTAPAASDADFPLNKPVLLAGSRSQAAKLRGTAGTGGGTLADALDAILDQAGALVVVVRVAEGADQDATRANVLGSADAGTGVYAFLHAENIVGYKPRILLAPGFTDYKPVSPTDSETLLPNPVVTSLIPIANELRAIIVADTVDGAVTDATAYAADFGTDRLWPVYPKVLRTDANGDIVEQPMSPVAAGIIARTDNDLGFWNSPSNKPVNNILGTSKPISFSAESAVSQANVLNEGKVATIVRQAGSGFLMWGNHTTASDARFTFLAVRRTADIINESVVRAHLWAVDRGITKTYVQDVVEGVNGFLRTLKTLGAIIDGRCWCDPDLNPPELIAQGIVTFSFDFTPPYSAEHIIFRSQLTNAYLSEIF